MIVAIDTNIFIYVLQQNAAFYQSALVLLQAVEAGNVKGVASELAHLEILADSKLDDKTLTTAQHFLRATHINFAAIDSQVLAEAARLRRTLPRLKTPDAIHLASALLTGADWFVTNDNALHKLALPIKIIPLKKASEVFEA